MYKRILSGRFRSQRAVIVIGVDVVVRESGPWCREETTRKLERRHDTRRQSGPEVCARFRLVRVYTATGRWTAIDAYAF